jgi:hypothetical protein
MVITDNVLLSRAVDGQIFSVRGEWFYMDASNFLYHLPSDLVQYIRDIEALQSIGKILHFNKPFIDGINISIIRHTSLAQRLLDPTKDSSQLHLSQDKSIFIKDAALFFKNGALRVQTLDGKIAADIIVQNGKPVSVSETTERLAAAGRKAVIPYGYLCRGSSFAPLEVNIL